MDYIFLAKGIILQIVVFTIIPFIVWIIRKRKALSFPQYVGLVKPQLAVGTGTALATSVAYIVVYIGRSTLLITPEYGNMVWLSVILTELNLEPDELLDRNYCEHCHLCEHACPVQAIGEPEMNQSACWEYAFGPEGQGDWRIKCHRCRDACPHCFGNGNREMRRFTV